MGAVSQNLARDDAELVARAQDREESACAEIYRRHADYIAGVVYRLLGADEALDDLVQETFVQGLDGLAGLREAGQLRRWLTTIAVRAVQRHLARRYRKRALVQTLGLAFAETTPQEHRDRVDTIYRALTRIPASLRVPWTLHRIEGETMPAVAELCGQSLSTIKRRIAEADRRLQRRLRD